MNSSCWSPVCRFLTYSRRTEQPEKLCSSMSRQDTINPVCDDRITILPADVIHRILMFLPLKAAARTALLSTQWRSHWRRMPKLVFCKDFSIAANDESMMKTLIFNICRVLLLHDGPIEKFTLAVPGLRWAPCQSEIDQIIVHLSNRDLRGLELAFNVRENHQVMYKLHSALFSCHQLNAACLCYCEFRQPSWFVGFGKLNILRMCQVILPTDFFENFLGKCPNLQTLLVDDCVGPSNIEVVAPRLQTFTFYGYLLQICFKRTPLLQSLVIDLHGRREEFEKPVVDTRALFASLPALQQFRLDFQLLQNFARRDQMEVPSRLPAPLHRIQSVNISRVDLGSSDKAFAFACLITSLPNLLYLTIQLEASLRNRAVAILGFMLLDMSRHREPSCCLQNLRVLAIRGCLATRIERDVVKFVLGIATLLERVQLTSLHKLEFQPRFEFMKEVLTYPRASRKAVVIYD